MQEQEQRGGGVTGTRDDLWSMIYDLMIYDLWCNFVLFISIQEAVIAWSLYKQSFFTDDNLLMKNNQNIHFRVGGDHFFYNNEEIMVAINRKVTIHYKCVSRNVKEFLLISTNMKNCFSPLLCIIRFYFKKNLTRFVTYENNSW